MTFPPWVIGPSINTYFLWIRPQSIFWEEEEEKNIES